MSDDSDREALFSEQELEGIVTEFLNSALKPSRINPTDTPNEALFRKLLEDADPTRCCIVDIAYQQDEQTGRQATVYHLCKAMG